MKKQFILFSVIIIAIFGITACSFTESENEEIRAMNVSECDQANGLGNSDLCNEESSSQCSNYTADLPNSKVTIDESSNCSSSKSIRSYTNRCSGTNQ